MKKYRCPSPIAVGDCPYYNENGYCLMVNGGSNPLKECDDAMYFDEDGEGWEGEDDKMSIKDLGVIRGIDEFGRIAIPKDIRRELGLKEDTIVEFFCSTDETGKKYLMLAPFAPPKFNCR